ncbi:MAG: hypothetical protein R2837_06015 [Aliarcobacter sp.]
MLLRYRESIAKNTKQLNVIKQYTKNIKNFNEGIESSIIETFGDKD